MAGARAGIGTIFGAFQVARTRWLKFGFFVGFVALSFVGKTFFFPLQLKADGPTD